MSGTVAHPEGITNPPIDDLLQAADGSKYGLVIYAAKRARQINAYYSLLSEGQLENVGPLVETHVQEKPLSVALREIDAGLLTVEPHDPTAVVEAGYDGELGEGFDDAAAALDGGFDAGFEAAVGASFDEYAAGDASTTSPDGGIGDSDGALAEGDDATGAPLA